MVVDDKGVVAIVVVGLPPFYHEDNAARGLTCALKIQKEKFQSSIGVTTGSCFCGCIGSKERTEYAVVGDTIILGEKLVWSGAT